MKGACGELGAKGQPGRDAVCQPQVQIKGEKGDRGANGPPGRDGSTGKYLVKLFGYYYTKRS